MVDVMDRRRLMGRLSRHEPPKKTVKDYTWLLWALLIIVLLIFF